MGFTVTQQDDPVRFGLRLPKPIYEALKRIARRNHRSLNSEICLLLGQASKDLWQAHHPSRADIEAQIDFEREYGAMPPR